MSKVIMSKDDPFVPVPAPRQECSEAPNLWNWYPLQFQKEIRDLSVSSEWSQEEFIHFLLSYICYPGHVLGLPFEEWLSGEYLEQLVESKQSEISELRKALSDFKSLGRALLVLKQEQ